jgi:hypothetical protein
MIKLIYIPFLFASLAHAAPLSWPHDAVMRIEKAKTVKELACSSHASIAAEELCALYKKEFGAKVSLKFERLNDSTLLLKSGSSSVKIERTERPMQFMINDRLLDLTKYPNQERVGFALDAILAPRSAWWPSVIERAFAAADMDPTLKPGLQSLLVLATQDGNCKTLKQLSDTCIDGLDPILAYFKANTETYRTSMNAGMKKAISEKLDAVSALLNKIHGRMNAHYGYALGCDCKDQPNQVACTNPDRLHVINKDGVMRDDDNLTVPRQQGMDKCQRFLKLAETVPATRDFKGSETAKNLLNKIDQDILNLKNEGAGPAVDPGAIK